MKLKKGLTAKKHTNIKASLEGSADLPGEREGVRK